MFRKFRQDTSGQFAIMFSVLSTMLLGLVMVGVDTSNLISSKTKVSTLTDAAALAGASVYGKANREEVVLQFLQTNGYKMLPAKFAGDPIITFNDIDRTVAVSVSTQVDTPFASIMGMGPNNVGYKTKAGYAGLETPLTIAFALDVSGSMGDPTPDGVRKIDALKTAITSMFEVIERKAESYEVLESALRTGMSAFNEGLEDASPMEWGYRDTQAGIDNLEPDGWTNSAVALDNAYNQILNDRAFRIADDPNFDQNSLDEYVIFMTDGANTFDDPILLDEQSYETCLSMREEGIEVYAIAFEAPEEGQLLLMDCSSWDDAVEDRDSKKIKNRGKKCGRPAKEPNENANNGNGKKKGFDKKIALDKCRKDVLDDKKEHYFDANDAKSFEEVFQIIGRNIEQQSIRIIE